MKKIITAMSLMLGLSFSYAQQASTASSNPSVTKNVKTTEQKVVTKKQVADAKVKDSDVKSSSTNVKLKKDGTPDRRFKQSKKLKKDGTPDMRFKTNKK